MAATLPTLALLAAGGVIHNRASGESWGAANNGLAGEGVVVLAIDPQFPRTVYAGGPKGLFRSTDGGVTWRAANKGLTRGDGVAALAIDPQTPQALYASTHDAGVFKSTDGGTTWLAASRTVPDGPGSR